MELFVSQVPKTAKVTPPTHSATTTQHRSNPASHAIMRSDHSLPSPTLTFFLLFSSLFFSLPCVCVLQNFLALCASNRYDNTIFHRNIAKFLIQGGDPTNTGKGGTSIYASESNPHGYFADEIVEGLRHDQRGIVSMANRGPNTNASQFFITYGAQPSLNHLNTVFGHVIDGMEVLDAMERAPVDKKDRPIKGQEIRILSVKIHANPIAEQES